MRFLYLMCLLPFQVWADFSVLVTDSYGAAVPDAVVSYQAPVGVHAVSEQNPSLAPAVMDQINMQFDPHVLVVSQGQKVGFPNSDDTRHHVYSFSQAKSFELKLFKGTNSSPVIMNNPGVVELGCNIHDQMLGYIYVDDSGTAVKTNHLGMATLTGGIPDALLIWHSRLKIAKGQRVSIAIDELANDGDIKITLDLTPNVSEQSLEPMSQGFKRKFSRQGG